MYYKNFKFKIKFHKWISMILTMLLAFSYSWAVAAQPVPETPEAVYSGISNASVMLNNMDYTDVKNSNTWAKEAIYETAALDMMKGYGAKNFGRTNTLTKEQAIAVAYRVVGREADAQKAAEALDNARAQGQKKTNPISMWSDGYLQLAANEGLISQQDLTDAFNSDQTSLGANSFHRDAPAQRQDMAYWLAKTLKLPSVYDQQKIFNSYNDWQNADPIKIPYIEAVLQNNIMNGDGNGKFNPQQPITREQVAQIIKNAEGLVLPLFKYAAKTGTIEDVSSKDDLSSGTGVTTKTFNIRNSDGKLHQIITQTQDNLPDSNRSETSGNVLSAPEKELVVYKNGKVGKSDLLNPGDRIEYITAPDNTVKFVDVIPGSNDVTQATAVLNSIDPSNLLMNVSDSDNVAGGNGDTTYRYSNNASVTIDNKNSNIGSLKLGSVVQLTIQNNIVTDIKAGKPPDNVVKGENDVDNGIVEDNNPQLGYITLYNENGTGTSSEWGQLPDLRTFNYANPNDLDVTKNDKKASIADIGVGDSVFIKADDNGNVLSISAVDNYTPQYGKVISKQPSQLVVEYDDGTQQVLDADDSIPVVSGTKLVGYSSLKDGDRVKLLLDENNKFTKLKEVTIEGDEHLVTNLYKGTVSNIDDTSNNLVALNLQVLDNGKWQRTDQKGFSDIKLADGCNMYNNDQKVDADGVNNYLKNNEAYIAVEKDYGGAEQAVLVSFRKADDTEALYDDSIVNAVPGAGEFGLSKEFKDVKYNPGTIIVKDGRLVSGNSVTDEDLAYVVANRDFNSGDYNAGIVQINERPDVNFAQIYRARISKIDENTDFTVDSFSQLDGNIWDYSNTPKTFNITYDTRILDDSGVINVRNFVGYGTGSFVDRTVYVVADGANALLISTAPYGVYNSRGEIYDITGGTIGADGEVLTQPTAFSIWNAKTYDLTNHIWNDSKDITLNILKNSIILKDNKIAQPSDLKKGDQVRVLRKDDTLTGDAYIVIVEG